MDASDNTIDAMRDELQKLRIAHTGLVTDIEELKAEVACLRTENDDLRAKVPQKKERKAQKRKTRSWQSSQAEDHALRDELAQGEVGNPDEP